jgi:hypothetical protein
MKTLVKVTRKHIKNGVIKSCIKCPVSLALLDAFTNVPAVLSDELRLTVFKTDDSRLMARAPRSVTRFIMNFDNGKKVRPFNFIFDTEK